MSRTMLSALTAAGLITCSVALMAGRYRVLGDEVLVPHGPGTWKVTMKFTGKTTGTNARLLTVTPLDFGRQHVLREECSSEKLLDKPPAARHPERREVQWSPRAGVTPGEFTATYEFYCAINVTHPSSPMSQLMHTLYAAPAAGVYLQGEPLIESDHHDISVLARNLTVDHDVVYDQVEAMYRHVERQVGNEPNIGGSGAGALECLQRGRGDATSKSRLLVALCRNRGIPARLVTGLALTRGDGQVAHAWMEAWIRDQWLPMCPFHHQFGHLPPNNLILGIGDQPIVHGRNVRDLDYACMIERTDSDEAAAAGTSRWTRILKGLSLDALPPPEQRLVEFLLLLPIAALMVCIYRNVIGIGSFGTFAPALIGLAFRELASIPGILVFVSIVLIGWVLRRGLDRYHLLQVPRTAVMLSLVVIVLITSVVAANYHDLPATKYIPLFPIVILTGMIERFWTLETEDSTTSSFRTLIATMLIAGSIALVLSIPAVIAHMFRFPETLGIIMALQLLLGRYTGYRFTELFRFRDFLEMKGAGA